MFQWVKRGSYPSVYPLSVTAKNTPEKHFSLWSLIGKINLGGKIKDWPFGNHEA